MPIGIEIALKRINDEYGNASNHRERALLDYVLAVTETETRDPVQGARVVGHGAQRSDFHRSLSMLALLWMLLCIAEDGAIKGPTALTTPATPAAVDTD
ncbi:unnamed protein product [Albugo candida]|uniref:Uncharacterized protein n=1 Tax=Albugo candida TaxID=65357 RepID=A0A024FXG4_9STRA|nr:unnamed protein product [Albugo candida]|eukprot:CCI11810.1 unnamed protein product [Albugo candida]